MQNQTNKQIKSKTIQLNKLELFKRIKHQN